jgi:hypothetical protein
MEIVYDAALLGEAAPLTGVDNLVVHADSKDLFVAEDGGNMELVLITHESREVAPFLRYPVPHSEICGLAFDPSGTRLYFASQGKRHSVDEATGQVVFGEIFEVSGPFRGATVTPPPPPPPPGSPPVDGGSTGRFGGAFVLGALAAVAAAALLRGPAANPSATGAADDGPTVASEDRGPAPP